MSDARLLVRGGTVWTEAGPERRDVLVVGERIAALTGPGEVGDAAELDASGLHVLPGMIDLHVHLDDRIGPYELADGFPSGSRAAVAAGITTVCAFATQLPGESVLSTARRWAGKVAGRCLCDVHLHLTPTGEDWDWPALEELVRGGWRTLKLYTTYRQAGLFTSWERLDEVMERLPRLGAGLLLHCEDDAVLSGVDATLVDLGDPFSHTVLRPETAEVEAVRRAVRAAARTGCRLHVVHVSTADAAELVAAAAVTCETGPQYVLLDAARLAAPGGHRLLCSPPLRCEATRERLERLVVAGAVDVLATDHCPFRRADKDAWVDDFRAVPNGVAGLGALPGLAHEVLCGRHGLPLGALAERLAAAPARVAGLYPRKGSIRPGADADLAIVDPGGPRRGVRSSQADAWETYEGFTSTLAVRHVLLRGRVVARDGVVAGDAGFPGRCLAAAP